MSRSEYVWTVVIPEELLPLAVFTVKYQCADWLKRHAEGPVEVYRMRDGHLRPKSRPVWLDPETLKPREGQEEGP
jgi:hypothetical protein